MKENTEQFKSWQSVLHFKTQMLYAQITEMRNELSLRGATDEVIETLCKPYYKALESIYTEDYPLANAIENSDLVVKLEGYGVDKNKPRVSVISSYFGKVRHQVTNIAKAVADLDTRTKIKEFDLTLTAFAKGSIVLGFSLPTLADLEEDGQPSLLGEEEPYYKAAREAMRTLGVVAHYVSEGESMENLAEAVPDAKVRDITLSALSDLAPSGRQGVSKVLIAGKGVGENSDSVLTKESREIVKSVLKHPVVSKEQVKFDGQVREIDLDAKRLELRHIENNELNEVRCVYEDYSDNTAAEWLNKYVTVFGIVERGSNGKARLMEIETIAIN